MSTSYYQWDKEVDRWHLYCPQGRVWMLEWAAAQEQHPMGGIWASMPDDLWFFEAFRSAKFVLTRQGWERYEMLQHHAGEDAKGLLLRELERAAQGSGVPFIIDPEPAVRPPLRGSSYLDVGFVNVPYIPEGIL